MSDQDGDGCALLLALAVVFVGLPTLAMFFPQARELRPVALVLDLFGSLGVSFPSLGGGPTFVVVLYVGAVILVFAVAGVASAAALSNVFDFDVNLQAAGALASILGLLVSILSLML